MSSCPDGHTVAPGEGFCGECGKPAVLRVELDEAAVPTPPPSSGVPPPAPAPPTSAGVSPPPPTRTPRGARVAAALALTLLVVGAVGVTLLVLGRRHDDGGPARGPTASTTTVPVAAAGGQLSTAPLPVSPLVDVDPDDPCDGQVAPGHELVAVGSEFAPGADATLLLGTGRSEPASLGAVEADADGVAVVSFLVPDLPPGDLVAVRLEGRSAAGGDGDRAQTAFVEMTDLDSDCGRAATAAGELVPLGQVDDGGPAPSAPAAAGFPEVPPPLVVADEPSTETGSAAGAGVVAAVAMVGLIAAGRRRTGRAAQLRPRDPRDRPRGAPLALLVAVVSSVLLAGVAPGPAAAEDGAGYVALGDSYSSGEGVTPFGSATLDVDCHRSQEAYPRLLEESTAVDIATLRFSACSGAVTGDVVSISGSNGQVVPGGVRNPLQIASVTSDTDLVTVTLGGNDLDFAGILSFCALRTCLDDHYPTDDSDVTVPGWIERQRAEVVNRVGQVVRQARAAAAPSATIVLAGYPELFAPDPGIGCPEGALFDRDERTAVNGAIGDLNAALRREAEGAGAVFVDVAPAFRGHRVCEQASAADEFLTGIEVAFSQIFRSGAIGLDDLPVGRASFHPTAAGQQAYASAIEQALIDHRFPFAAAGSGGTGSAGSGGTTTIVDPAGTTDLNQDLWEWRSDEPPCGMASGQGFSSAGLDEPGAPFVYLYSGTTPGGDGEPYCISFDMAHHRYDSAPHLRRIVADAGLTADSKTSARLLITLDGAVLFDATLAPGQTRPVDFDVATGSELRITAACASSCTYPGSYNITETQAGLFNVELS